jgi:3,4-dihydroxy 2-butanone 4-phosphate synthase/GTP cyclohydrolase II
LPVDKQKLVFRAACSRERKSSSSAAIRETQASAITSAPEFHFSVAAFFQITMSNFSRLEDGLEALALGMPIIVLDSEDREDEGDFVVAAEKITPQLIHFLITHGRGQVCMPVTTPIAQRLELRPMVAAGGKGTPNFTVPIDHASCKTGISPFERCATIQAIMDEESGPRDFVRPGHMFPLVARDGGVLERQGHTEASVDLVRMAGLRPAAVLCEICSQDGLHMARRDELLHLAADCHIPLVTIDDLIEVCAQEQRRTSAIAEGVLVTA